MADAAAIAAIAGLVAAAGGTLGPLANLIATLKRTNQLKAGHQQTSGKLDDLANAVNGELAGRISAERRVATLEEKQRHDDGGPG